MSKFQFYVHKDTYNPATATEITAELTQGVVRNVRYDAYDKDFKITIANNTMRIRDESNANPLGARQYYTYFRDNTITYIDVYYNSNKIYTGWVLKDTVRRRWYEGTYWTEFTIAHVMTLLDTKYINFYTTELGAFEDLTKQVIQVLPATRLIYTLDTMKDDDDNVIIPPYEDSGESFELTALQFAGEFTAGDVDELLIPSSGYLQIGRETTAYSAFTIEDSPYSEKKIIIFTISDRTSPAYGSTEYWDYDTFMVLDADTSYINTVNNYNLDLAADDTEKNFYWSTYSSKMNYLQQSDYDEAGNETTIPHVVGMKKIGAAGCNYVTAYFMNDVLETDIMRGYVEGTATFDVDTRPVWGNWFSSSGHAAYNFLYYIGIDLAEVRVWLQKIYQPSASDTTIVSWYDSGTTTIDAGGLVYTGDDGKPEVVSTVYFPYVRWYEGLDNVYDFQFLQKPSNGFHYLLVLYKNGSNYELRTYKVSVNYGGFPTTAHIIARNTLGDWLSAGTLLSTRVIGTTKPVLLRNVAGLSRVDADGKQCRTRTYFLDGEIQEYQIIIEDGFYAPSSDTDALPTFSGYSADGYSVSASSEYSTDYAWRALDDNAGTVWRDQDPVSPAFTGAQLQIDTPSVNEFDRLPTFTGNTTNGYTITASTDSTNAYKAADDNTSTYWTGFTDETFRILFPQSETCYKYTLTSGSFYPQSWQFQGSNNGSDWTVLDTKTGQTFTNGVKREFEITNTDYYNYYRFVFGAGSDAAGVFHIKEMEIMCHVSKETVYKYYITAGATEHPTAWTFEGSDDESDWTVLDTRTGESFSGSKKTYTITSPHEYSYYRLNVTDVDAASYSLAISEFDFSVYLKSPQILSDNEIALTYEASYPEIEPEYAVGIHSYFMLDDGLNLRRVVKVPSAEIDISDTTALDILNVYRKLKLAIMWVDSSNVLQIKALSKIFADFDPETATELETENIEWLEKEIYDYRNITIGDDSFIKTERVRVYYKLKIAELFSSYEEKFTIKYRTDTFLDILSPVTFLDEAGARRYGVVTGYNIINSENDIPAIDYSILTFSLVMLAPVEDTADFSEVI